MTASDSTVGESKAKKPNLVAIFTAFAGTYGAAAYAIAIAVFYVAGFLALNAYLSTQGIYDFEFVSPRIVLAGAGFCFFLLCFYLFAGRAVLFTPKWLGQDLEIVTKGEPSVAWRILVFIYSFIHATFFICFSAAIFVSIAIGQVHAVLFYAVVAIAFLFLYPLDATNFDIRHPKATILVRLAFEAGAIVAFFLQPNNAISVTAFFTYLGMFAFVNLLLDKFDRHTVSADTVGFSVLYTILFVAIVASTAYGALFYGKTSNKLGGARPLPMEFVLSAAARTAVGDSEIGRVLASGKGELLYQTDAFLYVLVNGSTIRINSTDLVALRVIPDRSLNSLDTLLQDLFPSSGHTIWW